MSLTYVGKLLNKVDRNPNGREKMRNISVSYSDQFKIIHFICSLDYLSFFYHNMTCIHISKQYHNNRNLVTVLIIRKTRKKNYHPRPILHLNWPISLRTVDFTEF